VSDDLRSSNATQVPDPHCQRCTIGTATLCAECVASEAADNKSEARLREVASRLFALGAFEPTAGCLACDPEDPSAIDNAYAEMRELLSIAVPVTPRSTPCAPAAVRWVGENMGSMDGADELRIREAAARAADNDDAADGYARRAAALKASPAPRCTIGPFGQHSGAFAGEGCDGCDKEHERMLDKHVGDVLPGGEVRKRPSDAQAACCNGTAGCIREYSHNSCYLAQRPGEARPKCGACSTEIQPGEAIVCASCLSRQVRRAANVSPASRGDWADGVEQAVRVVRAEEAQHLGTTIGFVLSGLAERLQIVADFAPERRSEAVPHDRARVQILTELGEMLGCLPNRDVIAAVQKLVPRPAEDQSLPHESDVARARRFLRGLGHIDSDTMFEQYATRMAEHARAEVTRASRRPEAPPQGTVTEWDQVKNLLGLDWLHGANDVLDEIRSLAEANLGLRRELDEWRTKDEARRVRERDQISGGDRTLGGVQGSGPVEPATVVGNTEPASAPKAAGIFPSSFLCRICKQPIHGMTSWTGMSNDGPTHTNCLALEAASVPNASKARVETELNRVRREALVLVDDFHANGMARSREGDEGAAAAYNDAGRDLSSLLGQSLDRSSRGTPSSSPAGPRFDRALEWIRRRFPTWPGHIESAAYLERLLDEERAETIEACAVEAERCLVPGSTTLTHYGRGRKEAAETIRALLKGGAT
jgi:hypothetical protein